MSKSARTRARTKPEKLPMRRTLSIVALSLGMVGLGRPAAAPVSSPGGEVAPLEGDTTFPAADLRNDPRVRAFLQTYGERVRLRLSEEDAIFLVGEGEIHFQDGRMLGPGHLADAERFEPFFYRYPLGPLAAPLSPEHDPAQSKDVLELLFGRTETEIRRHCESITFLGRKLFLNRAAIEPLREVEREILAMASQDADVAAWSRQIEIAYSFIDKGIAGSGSRSYHSWGLAVDLVPTSYGGKQVYWRWSRVFNRQDWHRIPLEERWSPPAPVIQAFERHGFVWGGKWAHFDTIHFEYRPEILLYNRMISD